MKALGVLLLLSGWLLVVAALVLLHSPVPLAAFLAAAVCVELLGLFFLVRSHIVPKGDPR